MQTNALIHHQNIEFICARIFSRKMARLTEGRSESGSMFVTGKVLVSPHHAVIAEADAKTASTCCPCFRSAPKGGKDVPNVTIPPEAQFKNGGNLAYRNQVVQQEKKPCILL